jgi:hypothetical protein
MSQQARWFLAHRKDEDDIQIDVWCNQLKPLLASPGWEVAVTAGRDDYELRARAMGGWHRWCEDVGVGIDWNGNPLFHGVIVPTSYPSPCVGRATSNLVESFLRESKYVFLWCPTTQEFSQVSRVERLPNDNWQAWASLIPITE